MGLDISTSCVGICVLKARSSELLYLSHRTLSKFDDEYDKGDAFDFNWIEPTWKIRKIYIEAAAMKFTSGFSSAGTIMTLGRFNGIVSYNVYKHTGVKPEMVNVRSARSKMGIKIDYKDKSLDTKTKVLNIVMAINPDFPWTTHLAKSGKSAGKVVFDKTNQDRCDAWVIARGGQILIP